MKDKKRIKNLLEELHKINGILGSITLICGDRWREDNLNDADIPLIAWRNIVEYFNEETDTLISSLKEELK